MEVSVEIKGNVIVRSFKGDVYLEDIIKSWNEIFFKYEDLRSFDGILTDLLAAEVQYKDENFNILLQFLKENLHRMEGMKIALVMDTPKVTNTIMMDRKMKNLQIRPFSTKEAALNWITLKIDRI